MRKEELLKSHNSKILRNSVIEDAYFKNHSKDELINKNTFSSGTTTVGLTCKDAVILATDKRATMAYFIASKTAEKLHKIQEHLYLTIAGSVADAQYLVDVLKAETTIYQLEKERPIPIKAAGRLLSNILYQHKMFPFQVGHILGGVTEEEGPIILDIGAYGSILPEKYVAVGSGQNFSFGVLEAKYKDDLNIEEGKKIAIQAVTSSIIRDMASGNGIDIAVIKKQGPAERDFLPIK
ncbi:MAG: archaeal proteasome endopeptidase complex subunit beta [Promethearchaeota archaeon]|nr:MAG: archaeal proteasome endopeptidase complex subunit beta [Candidatus Lokiarchaeota archaeon]